MLFLISTFLFLWTSKTHNNVWGIKLTSLAASRLANISSEEPKCAVCQTRLVWTTVVQPWHFLPAKEEHRTARVTFPAPQTLLEAVVTSTVKPMYWRIKPRVRRSHLRVPKELRVYRTLIVAPGPRP